MSVLSPYRVLDLTTERGLLCGQMLGDMGADIIKVEPPGGCSARSIGPFYKDAPHPDRSLYWWAYNRNKRAITLDIERDGGRDLLRRLVEHADFLIESHNPGYLSQRKLGFADLTRINPALIYVSITPFGQDGPKASYADSDLIIMAAGGPLILAGDADRPPVRKLDRISSVSGGSIVAGVLGMNWEGLGFDPSTGVSASFLHKVVGPVRRLASVTVQYRAAFPGLVWPPIASKILASAYREHLFADRTLQHLPNDLPRFIFNATNVQTGALSRFSKPFMADWRVGMVENPKTPLAEVVAASSAFPPFLAPAHLDLTKYNVRRVKGNNLHKTPFTSQAVLTDGGVYDNLGLETTWKDYETILASDGGQNLSAEPHPWVNWLSQLIRTAEISNEQTVDRRKHDLIQSYELPKLDPDYRYGAYWGIRSEIASYRLPTPTGYPFTTSSCAPSATAKLASVRTGLKRLEPQGQERLINWGYAICDVAMRKWVDPTLPTPGGFPYPSSGV